MWSFGYALISIQTSKHTKEVGALQKGADFVKAYALGFEVNVSIIRNDHLHSLHMFARTPSPLSAWTICTLIRSKSRMSRHCTATTFPVPLVVLQDKTAKQSSLLRTPVARGSFSQIRKCTACICRGNSTEKRIESQ